jgi:hypothetical protein
LVTSLLPERTNVCLSFSWWVLSYVIKVCVVKEAYSALPRKVDFWIWVSLAGNPNVQRQVSATQTLSMAMTVCSSSKPQCNRQSQSRTKLLVMYVVGSVFPLNFLRRIKKHNS